MQLYDIEAAIKSTTGIQFQTTISRVLLCVQNMTLTSYEQDTTLSLAFLSLDRSPPHRDRPDSS